MATVSRELDALGTLTDADLAVTRFLRHHFRVAALTAYLLTSGRSKQVRPIALREAAVLHDFGRLPLLALTEQPRPLTPFEREAVASHAVMGAMMLESAGCPADVVLIVRHHHERWDGAGVPDQLAGPAIPLGARILAVADAIVAMAEYRNHSPGFTLDMIADELSAQRGGQFDPDLVDRALSALTMRPVRRLLGKVTPRPGKNGQGRANGDAP